jgi:hypothetical protein
MPSGGFDFGGSALFNADFVSPPHICQQAADLRRRQICVKQKTPARRAGRPPGVRAHAILHQLGLNSRATTPSAASVYCIRPVKFALRTLHRSPCQYWSMSDPILYEDHRLPGKGSQDSYRYGRITFIHRLGPKMAFGPPGRCEYWRKNTCGFPCVCLRHKPPACVNSIIT